MNKPFLMGIDIGTYSAKGVIVRHDGKVCASSSLEYNLSIPKPGWAEHDAELTWWFSFTTVVKDLLRKSSIKASEIAAVGCSAIGPTMLPVDRRGYPLRPAVLYGIDTRAWREISELSEKLNEETILARCGNILTTQAVGPKILWFRKHEPELFKSTHKILTATSYVVYKLTGKYAIDTYTASSFVPMFNMAEMRWDSVLSQDICPLELLPEPYWASDVVGEVTQAAANQTGLARGTPVIAGTVDAAAEAIGAGVVSPGETMLMYGSTLFVLQVLKERKQDRNLWSAIYCVPSTYALAAGLATSAALIRWFRDNFGHAELESEKLTGISAYEALAKQAEQVPPGSNGLLVLPYFSGERTPINDPKARGVIAGLTLKHTKKHVYRALLEGVAYALRHNLETMEQVGAKPKKFVAVGGGTRNPVWLQIISDCIGQPQELSAVVDGAPYGSAYMAGLGVGIFSNFDQLKQDWAVSTRTIYPNLDHHGVYSSYYEIFRKSYDRLKEELHKLADLGKEGPD